MFKNCVFKADVDATKWMKAAGIRALKTVAESALTIAVTAQCMGDVDWKMVASAAVLAGITSLLISVKGIPEVAAENEDESESEEK